MTRFTNATNILKVLEQKEKLEGVSKRRFAWRRAWLARSNDVLSALWDRGANLRSIPGLKYNRLAALVLDREKIEVTTSADAIQVSKDGERLRAFYVAQGKTLKVTQREGYYGEETLREIKLRKDVSEKSSIRMPAIEHVEEKDGYIFIQEQMIKGRAYSVKKDKALFCEQVVAPLKEFYASMGTETLKLSKALGAMTVFAYGHKETMPEGLLDLIQRDPEVVVSLCHNDVVSSNLAVSDGKVYFLDWGSALKTLCGRDFVRIGRRYLDDKTIVEYMDNTIRELQGDALGLQDMLMIQDLWIKFIEFHGDGKKYSGVESKAA